MVAFNFCGRFLQQTWTTLDSYAPVGLAGIGKGINRNKKPSGASVTVTAVCVPHVSTDTKYGCI